MSLFTSLISSCWAEIFNHKNTSCNCISYPTWIYSSASTITLLYKYLRSSHNWNPLGLHLSSIFLWRILEDSRTCRSTETSVLITWGLGFTEHRWVPPLRACRCSQVLLHLHWTTARMHKLQEKTLKTIPKKPATFNF